MPDIIERFRALEAEQARREKEKQEKEKRELEEAIKERTIVVNCELVDKLRPLVSILKEAEIEKILEEILKIKTDLVYDICLQAEFSVQVREEDNNRSGYSLNKHFSKISDIFSTKMIFPSPYQERYYKHEIPETLLEAKSLALERQPSLEVEVRWDRWTARIEDYGYSYIRVKSEYSEEGKILKISDRRGENVLGEGQLKSEQIVADAIILAMLNPNKYSYFESEDRGL